MKNELTYTKASEELQEIVAEIEKGQINIDTLSVKLKRAAELIHFCKQKLSATEADVQQILDDLQKSDA